jgi:hypothetical protein
MTCGAERVTLTAAWAGRKQEHKTHGGSLMYGSYAVTWCHDEKDRVAATKLAKKEGLRFACVHHKETGRMAFVVGSLGTKPDMVDSSAVRADVDAYLGVLGKKAHVYFPQPASHQQVR